MNTRKTYGMNLERYPNPIARSLSSIPGWANVSSDGNCQWRTFGVSGYKIGCPQVFERRINNCVILVTLLFAEVMNANTVSTGSWCNKRIPLAWQSNWTSECFSGRANCPSFVHQSLSKADKDTFKRKYSTKSDGSSLWTNLLNLSGMWNSTGWEASGWRNRHKFSLITPCHSSSSESYIHLNKRKSQEIKNI